MNDRQLECFTRAATNLSFHKTAEELYLSQPGVSHSIKTLEKELGFELVRRESQKISLTAAGEAFYRDAAPAYAALKNAARSAAAVAERPERRTVRLWQPSLTASYLAQLLQSHEESGGAYDIAFIHDMFLPPVDVVRNRAADVAYCMLEDFSSVGGDVVFKQIGTLQDCCVMRRDHPLAEKGRVGFGDLHGTSIAITHSRGVSTAYAHLVNLISNNVPDARLHYFGDDERPLAIANVIAGKCVSFEALDLDAIPGDGPLAALPFDGGRAYTMGVCYLADNDTPEVRHLAELLAAIPNRSAFMD